MFSVELQHRGEHIRARMRQRAGYRRRRRSANRRYRARRGLNRTHAAEWLPPSARHRVDTIFSTAKRLSRWAPVHVERAAFRGMPSSGPLTGTDARSHLRAAWNNACAYCDATGVPLNIEHLTPRSRGGSSRLSNLVIACVPCNQAKGSKPVEIFLAHRPDRLARILQQTEAPLHDAAAMNAICRPLIVALESLGKPVYAWSGRLTRENRTTTGLPKSHTLDALSVGPLDHQNGARIVRFAEQVLVARATGRGSYARTTPDRYGAGTWTGRVSVRASSASEGIASRPGKNS